jgi:signal transduction histidine kinase
MAVLNALGGAFRLAWETAWQRGRVRSAAARATLGSITGGVVHELNNPTTFVSLSVGHMSRHVQSMAGDSDAVVAAMDVFAREVEEALEQVRATALDFLAIRSQGRSKLAGATNLNRLIRAGVRFARASQRSQARVEVDVPESLAAPSHFTPLGLAIAALVSNALDAVSSKHAQGLVHVSVELVAGMLRIRVEDNGVGMRPWLCGNAPRAFFSTRPDGAGLGLTFATMVVEELGGVWNLTSGEGEGTTVRVELPGDECDGDGTDAVGAPPDSSAF